MKFRQITLLLVDAVLIATLVACGGGGGSKGGGGGSTPPPTTFTIGGSVSSLSGTGLVLQDNGGDNLSISANGAFTFATPIDSGSSYNVTVLTQPSTPAQTCAVTSGTGTATANVTTVQVACTTTATNDTIGGTVSGLSGTGLVLQNNGGNNLTITANGIFTFSTSVASGGAYDVTVLTQPSSPAQTCAVTDGSGTANANVTSVVVACANLTASEWTWESGAAGVAQAGAYGTLGTPAPGNVPGGRYAAVRWTDAAGNFWLFGGLGYDSTGSTIPNYLNDLWEYSAGEWTWMGGSNLSGEAGTYGTEGTAAPGNIPGGRAYAITWTDAAGNFWLFGGSGLDSTGSLTSLNDLWKYSAGQWTWMSGSDVGNKNGTYGTEGTAAPGNIPGGRGYGVSWADAAGNLWLFGGFGYDSAGHISLLNDLWKYSAGEWTWEGGSDIYGQSGTYGTEGTAAATNIPGAREYAVSWIDAAGNFWLFGGMGDDSTGRASQLNDLWKYSSGEWTWVAGSDVVEQAGTYGTLGTPASTNVPGARQGTVGWIDKAGNLWILGGNGYDSTGTSGQLNDLWEFSGGLWTWIDGSDVKGQLSTYGTEGTPAPANVPGARAFGLGWTDSAGNLWQFGGTGLKLNGNPDSLNDLWKFGP
jgi:N-acetylneuraminic acid mutarotase